MTGESPRICDPVLWDTHSWDSYADRTGQQTSFCSRCGIASATVIVRWTREWARMHGLPEPPLRAPSLPTGR